MFSADRKLGAEVMVMSVSQAQLLSLPREPSFAMSNATYDGVCMGNKCVPGVVRIDITP